MSSPEPATFAALGLRPELLEALTRLGYEEPTPIQLETIPPLLEGRDLVGQALWRRMVDRPLHGANSASTIVPCQATAAAEGQVSRGVQAVVAMIVSASRPAASSARGTVSSWCSVTVPIVVPIWSYTCDSSSLVEAV